MSWNYLSKANQPKDPRRVAINRYGYGKNWPKQRKAALERDSYTCQKCSRIGKRKSNGYWDVHVHHIRKIRMFVISTWPEIVIDYENANSLSNLMTLCEHCHPYADGHIPLKGYVML